MTPNNTHYSLLVGLCVGLCVQHSSEAFGDSWTGSPEAEYNLASSIGKLGSGWSVDPAMFSAIFYPHISSSSKHSFLFFLFILLSYNTSWPQPPLPLFSPLLTSPFSEIYCSSISIQERAGLPLISTKHNNIAESNKNRYKPAY